MTVVVASANARTVAATEREALATEHLAKAKLDVAAAREQTKRDVATVHGSVHAIEEKYKMVLKENEMLSGKCVKLATSREYREEFLGNVPSKAHPEFNSTPRMRPGTSSTHTAKGVQPPSPMPSPRR